MDSSNAINNCHIERKIIRTLTSLRFKSNNNDKTVIFQIYFRPIIRHEQKYDQLQIYRKKQTAAGYKTIQRC